ncbi:response regulator transcription factor [Mucilaginibacter phyllosphaerae]|uniref:DNA-binding NarL/FixJ family response regulator n=1 Tax=Mucilaginibacter phyllosphaerae TaxID=1812349 RepID=A0A4Y8AIN1_9SPHI|nr:response regulator transcription factor [Mucilaginibacter phyllosphaerae]MBB3968050.1 DNA-binding NarL/FixJ family response regulator [Mucilaginibacter phyllosphaerae]TEW68927.1 response regulator transcription factor [Mucilaginibacter phyllosphaerae]GGH01552.1 DNA-binding response regulator [Mucilaginibacter phyllosphaerae]
MIDIVLAEDHNIVRNGIISLLEKEAGINVAGAAINGCEVLTLLESGTHADVILADMNMPLMGGLDLTDQIKEKYPDCKIIILSALDHEKYVIKAFQAGASGYLLKSVGADELVFAVKHVLHNNLYICSELTTKFLKRLLTIPDPAALQQIMDIEFSAKEVEVLGLISEGYTNQEIADKLFTSKRTIESQRQTLIDKTGSRNTAALVRFAMSNGIVN